jgi:hypothetical protein
MLVNAIRDCDLYIIYSDYPLAGDCEMSSGGALAAALMYIAQGVRVFLMQTRQEAIGRGRL